MRLSALRPVRPLPPRKIPSTHLCYMESRPQCHSAAGRIRPIEKINLIRNRTRDLSACNTVPQPTMLPRAPQKGRIHEKRKDKKRQEENYEKE